ncbi:uncharacterized protein LOC130647701 [Hydractinia symbiolongicarpus]|uniref:uncharacterized protein LOC130647701 n=1 Tax=Hydractinia symbiolongicarpus TaxID=13093 RepID=UPI00254CA6A3|nr:uncharacterized protein LOC130647701 [Hydractinia symbiolongicarpus]
MDIHIKQFFIKTFLFACTFLPYISTKVHPDGLNYEECSPTKTTCEYWLVIQEKLTMIYEKNLVYAHKGKLYLYNEHHSNYTTRVPEDKVITVDGVNRMVKAVNGSVPGPPLVVYEGQTVTVHIRNMMLSDSLTIHFHGLHQKDTPYFDGMPYITQCPIAAGQSFTHSFKAEPKGTFWYHSHVGSQRSNGVFGAFIVKERISEGVDVPTDMIMTVGDWHHENSDEVYIKMIYGNYIGRDRYESTHTLDGGNFSAVPWVSGLFNGKGRYTDKITGKTVMAPLAWFNVTRGSKYRFRVIATGSIYPLRISIDNHELTIISSDGYDIEPWVVESFIINPGERYDFILNADQSYGNYWIRAVSMEDVDKEHSIEAILHYTGSLDGEPKTKRDKCTPTRPCIVLNCPFETYPVAENAKCIKIIEMKAAGRVDPPPTFTNDSLEYFLNFAFPGEGIEKYIPGAVNGRKFEYPGVNSLFQNEQIESDYDCAKKDCGEDKICHCHYELTVPYNKTIQFVWLNMGSGSGWAHPMHLHGHSFYVLKMGYPPQDEETGRLIGQNDDIDCGNTKLMYCNNAKWRNTSWKNGNIPGMNLKDPIRKDTIIIPTGGYAIIRLKSTNPGKWFMHCHIEVHALEGMAMVLNEAPELEVQPPPGFPICNNFYNDRSRDMQFLKEKKCEKAEEMKQLLVAKNGMNIIVTLVLGVVIVMQIFVICACAIHNKKALLKSKKDKKMKEKLNMQ